MATDRFDTGPVLNRRVTQHLTRLLPEHVSATEDYHLEGQRELPPASLPGNAETCLCLLEIYVGRGGQFQVHLEREFDRGTDSTWECTNRISRERRQSPFTYTVKTTVALGGEAQTKRAHVAWEELTDDPIYGGMEAQAAVLLAEKMAQLRARAAGNGMDHCGSLSRLGSLSNVINGSKALRVDWADIDELLGPDAETIAATAGFDALESDEKYREARQKGIDFLDDRFPENEPESWDCGPAKDDREKVETAEPWQTPPPGMTVTETETKLAEIQEQLSEMRASFTSGRSADNEE